MSLLPIYLSNTLQVDFPSTWFQTCMEIGRGMSSMYLHPFKEYPDYSEQNKAGDEMIVDDQSLILTDGTGYISKDLALKCARNICKGAPKVYRNEKLSTMTVPSERTLVSCTRKKLLVLNLNGLLTDIVTHQPPAGYIPYMKVKGKSVFKRPVCDSLLQFCFENFDDGVWSSRRGENLNMVIDFLMEDLKHKLLFFWQTTYSHSHFFCESNGSHNFCDHQRQQLLKDWVEAFQDNIIHSDSCYSYT